MSDILIRGMEMPKDIEPGLVIEFADGIDGKRYARLYHYRHGGLTEWLEAISAAEVRPVVRGFWVEENGEDTHTGELWCVWKCSECEAMRTAGWRHTQEGRKPRDNFCPNCGAKMEKS